ncbi:hypothetical protein MFLO_00920 [Listeria floridensis FSL S10-1187]|uniref:GIY-YIG domain-containing protein n=1 Tax=Listeria floridensis FSL S10-1187 TaxID=1265817 RepID=A0ABN0RIG0_9LIST|nr:DUF2075 domain-containing protein [Listeria floridensis]EUJ33754.1 hypothetical protein MFLO_00920 [Listeria floridensis FSL S10-1187]
MDEINAPIIKKIDYSLRAITAISSHLPIEDKLASKLLLIYPTVYIINDKQKKEHLVYVGETTDINRRTKEHMDRDIKKNANTRWNSFLESDTSTMYIIGHSYFNKSLTLDIENKLMSYMLGSEKVTGILNKRRNGQNQYYTSDIFDDVFRQIWSGLEQLDNQLFPKEPVIRDSALFKASPFHKLSEEQYAAKELILQKIESALLKDDNNQVIFVSGDAGTGKTVLISSLFYDLSMFSKQAIDSAIFEETNNYLLVNHDEQLTVYHQIAEKLGLLDNNKSCVSKPTKFIKNHDPSTPIDVALVDEGHLLWTQGKQAYQGKNQLLDIIKRAKITIVVFDRKQILRSEQYWEDEQLRQIENIARDTNNYISLVNQFRIDAGEETVQWIRSLIDYQTIEEIPNDKKYDLRIFASPSAMFNSIKKKMEQSGLARMLATFDWPYIDKKKPLDEEYWNVKIGNWSMPWNLQLPKLKNEAKNLAWAEQSQTIDEVGSTFTIQGFDLNYAGVIIGPSVKYRNGRIVFDKSLSKNKKATQFRTLSDGTKGDFSEEFLRNELNVLLTRGIRGLYLYAVDEELRIALLNAQNEKKKKRTPTDL